LHTRKQQVALLNTDTGEVRGQKLSQLGDAVERFYAALSPPVTVGIESTGYSLWFHAVVPRAPAAPRPYAPRRRGRQDPCDGGAENQDRSPRRPPPPGLLKDDRFPVVWVPDPTTRDRRALIKRRSKGPNSSAVGDCLDVDGLLTRGLLSRWASSRTVQWRPDMLCPRPGARFCNSCGAGLELTLSVVPPQSSGWKPGL
jgi:hypothetical protein